MLSVLAPIIYTGILSPIITWNSILCIEILLTLISATVITPYIGSLITISITSIPILSALYYFVYKEQSNISLRNQNSPALAVFLMFTLNIIINSIILLILEDRESYKDFYEPLAIFILIYVIVSLISLISFIVSSIDSLNIEKQFKKSWRNILSRTNRAYFIKNERISNLIYEDLHKSYESIFQSLEHTIKNKMGKVTSDEIKIYGRSLEKVMEGSPKKAFIKNPVIYPVKLYNINSNEYVLIYNSIIRNTGIILLKLNSNFKPEYNTLISILKSLEPNKVKGLYPGYFSGLKDIATNSLLLSDSANFNEMINLLESFFDSETNDKTLIGILMIYQALLKVSVQRNDISKITKLTYSLYFIREKNIESKIIKVSEIAQLITNNFPHLLGEVTEESELIQNLVKKESIDNKKRSAEADEIYPELSLFILFQTLFKAIELGNNASVGLLIKRISTDYTGDEISKLIRRFNKYKGDIKPAFKERAEFKEYNDLITDFSINQNSYDYCFQKLIFLIYGQQATIKREKLEFTKSYLSPVQAIDFTLFSINYLDYIYKKILEAGKDYGLLFVNDEEFMGNYLEYLKTELNHIPK